jgi:hypothetical protein
MDPLTRVCVFRARRCEPDQAPPSNDTKPLGVTARPMWSRGMVSGAAVLSLVPPIVV